jgi:hypothetical protein
MKGNAVSRFRAPPQLSRDRGRYETRVLHVLFGKERWFIEMFYPLFQSRREHSALALGGSAYSDAEVATSETPASLRHRSNR